MIRAAVTLGSFFTIFWSKSGGESAMGMRFPAPFVGVLLLTFSLVSMAGVVRGDIATLDTAVDFEVEDTTGDGTYDIVNDGESSLSIREFAFDGVIENRAILEFALSSIPTGAIIDSANLLIDVSGVTSSSQIVDIIGFVGNGELNLSDATAPGVLFGSYDPVAADLGPETISLDQTLFQSFFDANPDGFLALRLQGSAATVNTQIDASESATFGGSPPQLQVNFTPAAVPEPTSMMLLGLTALCGGFVGWRRSPVGKSIVVPRQC